MRIVFYGVVVVVAAVATLLLSIVIYRLSMRFRLYPKIRERDVHTRPTPRIGGAAMFLGMVVAFAVASQLPVFSLIFGEPSKVLAILGAALLIVLLGIADDIWDLDWYTKLAGQLIIAGLLAWQGGLQITLLPLPGVQVIGSPLISLLITVVLVTLVMNAVNFIDGLDGLVAGVAVIANSVFFVYVYVLSAGDAAQTDYFNLASLISAVIVGICLGFLPLNWRRDDERPARLFMGDGGALLIGLLMATSTIAVTGQLQLESVQGDAVPGQPDPLGGSGTLPGYIPVLLPLLVLIIPLLDFGLAVFRRLRAGKSPFSADRQHLHHRLLDMGHTHVFAVLIFWGWTAVASIGCLLFLFVDWWWALIALIAGFLVCAIITLAPLSRRKAVEAAVQSAAPEVTAAPEVAAFDPLDAAASERFADPGQESTDAEAEVVLGRLQDRESAS